MAYKRRAPPRKKKGRYGSKLRKAYRMRRWRSAGRQVVHRHFRWIPRTARVSVVVPAATAADQGVATYGLVYGLNQIVNFTELSQLYDQYKIIKAYTRFNWNYSIADTTTWNSPGLGKGLEMLIANDYDDVAAVSYDDLAQRSTTKRLRLTSNKPTQAWSCRPKILTEIYRSPISTSYNPRRAWLDFATTDVPHYGTRVVFINPYPTEVIVDIDIGYSILCRGTR